LRLDPGSDPSLIDTPSTFTSRGPRRIDSFLKPDISAPGDTIYSVSARTGKLGTSLSGTSMAAPHMTGVMALLRQWKSTWSVAELKADVMNTASYDITPSSPKYAPQRVGAGRVNVPDALTNNVIMFDSETPDGVSASFGAPEVTQPEVLTKVITVVSKAEGKTYTPSIVERTIVPGVTLTLSTMDDTPLTEVTVPAEGSTQFKLKMALDPSLMTHTRDATLPDLPLISRYWIAESSGLIQLTPSTGPVLRLPYYAAPRPASTLEAESSQVFVDRSGNAEVELTGNEVDTTDISAPPIGEVSLTTALELMGSSPNEDMGTEDPTIEKILDEADLKFVGAMTDAQVFGSVENPNARVYFGIATQSPWNSMNEVEFDIYIDVDQDGTGDYVLFNYNYGQATGGADPTDQFVTLLYDLNTDDLYLEDYVNGLAPSDYDTIAFNNDVVVLPVYTADFLTDSDPSFDFYVVSFAPYDVDGAIDISDVMSYDAAKPALDTTDGYIGLPAWYPGGPVPLYVDYTAGRDAGNLLLLYHHNASTSEFQKAEVVNIFDHFLYLPLVVK